MATAKNDPASAADKADKGGQVEKAKTTYTVISPLEYGEVVKGTAEARRYEIGEEVDLTDAVAAPLLGHTVKPKAADQAA